MRSRGPPSSPVQGAWPSGRTPAPDISLAAWQEAVPGHVGAQRSARLRWPPTCRQEDDAACLCGPAER
eukprot:8128401-Alexandrium_andersonii.AAC.1